MPEIWNRPLFSQSYIPHGHCYLWQPGLVGLHLLSDILTALAYYSIPLILLYFVRQRQNIPFRKIFLLFSLFILTCGTTHLMAVWTLWHPSYWLTGAIKAITALISVYTALELIPVIPQALALPNPQALEEMNQQLSAEIEERQEAETALQDQLEFDRLVAGISSRFINLAAAQISEGIQQALQEIGEFTGVDTSYLFRLSDDRASFNMTYEWMVQGLEPQREKAQHLPVAAFPWSTAQLLRGETIHIPCMTTLPKASAVDREHWQRFKLKSLIAVPLSDRDRILGWVGFASFREEKVWSHSSIQLLKIFGELLTNTLQRQQAEAELAQLYQDLEAKVEERTAALQESEQQFRSLFEAAPDLISVLDLEGAIQQVNPAAIENLGYPPKELNGRRLEEFLEPALQATGTKMFAALLNWGNARQELEFVRKDGTILTADCSCTLVGSDRVRNPYILVVQRDISDRKFLEQQLRTSEGRMRAVFEAMSDLVLTISLQGDRIPHVNIAPTHLIYSSEANVALVDRTIAEFLQSENREWLEAIREVVKTKQAVNLDYCLTVEGKDWWFAASISPLSDDSVVWVARDITERQQAEAQLQQLNQELRRSNQELEQFAYIASHDLREPLRMVTSFTKLLKQRYSGQLDAEADTMIDFAVDGATRMQKLIDALLAYSRVGQTEKPFELIDCQAVVESAIANLQLLVRETGTQLKIAPLPQVVGDRAQLIQLFQNLIDNAIKYCCEPIPKIAIGAEVRESRWLFWIQDNGIGIESKYGERIFKIFQRLHNRQEYSGTGIGLAICQKIVEYHNGQIWVESEQTSGSTFYFTLPIRV